MHNMLKIRQLHLSILFRLKQNSDAELRIRLRSIRIWWQYHRETSVYVKQGLTRSGVGRELYTVLEKALKAQNIVNVNACITYPEIEDEYVSKNSKRFHEHMGYRFVGEFRNCGYKFGRWYNVAWMEKYINDHERKPQPVKTFREIAADIIE